jgi:hypothetical protein
VSALRDLAANLRDLEQVSVVLAPPNVGSTLPASSVYHCSGLFASPMRVRVVVMATVVVVVLLLLLLLVLVLADVTCGRLARRGATTDPRTPACCLLSRHSHVS